MSVLTDNFYPLINEVHWKLETWGITERVGLLGKSLASAAKSISALVLAVLAGTAVGVTSGQFEELNHRALSLRHMTLRNAYLSFAALAGVIHPTITRLILDSPQRQSLADHGPTGDHGLVEDHDLTLVRVRAYQIMLGRPQTVDSR